MTHNNLSVHMQSSVRVHRAKPPFIALPCEPCLQHSPALLMHHFCTNKSPRQPSRRSRGHLWCLVPAGHCCAGEVCLLGPEGIAVPVVRPQGHHLCIHLRTMWCATSSRASMRRGKVAGEGPDRGSVQAQPNLVAEGNKGRSGKEAHRNQQVAHALCACHKPIPSLTLQTSRLQTPFRPL